AAVHARPNPFAGRVADDKRPPRRVVQVSEQLDQHGGPALLAPAPDAAVVVVAGGVAVEEERLGDPLRPSPAVVGLDLDLELADNPLAVVAAGLLRGLVLLGRGRLLPGGRRHGPR